MSKPTQAQVKKWTTALRSGAYSQTRNNLQNGSGHCCLGVACDLFIPKDKIQLSAAVFIDHDLPEDQEAAPEWLKIIDNEFEKIAGSKLSNLNDFGVPADGISRFSFNEIADVLELVYVHGALDEAV